MFPTSYHWEMLVHLLRTTLKFQRKIEKRMTSTHIFASRANSPINFKGNPQEKTGEDTRIYYMGGNGPHYSPPHPSPIHRNSSYALATLRPDGFLAVTPTTDTTMSID